MVVRVNAVARPQQGLTLLKDLIGAGYRLVDRGLVGSRYFIHDRREEVVEAFAWFTK